MEQTKLVLRIIWTSKLFFVSIWDGIRLNNNPSLLKKRINKEFKKQESKISSSVESFNTKDNTSMSFDASADYKKMAKLALKYWFYGDYFWGKHGNVNGVKSAIYYSKSAKSFEYAKEYVNAGRLYHFAGHQFRTMDSQRKAMENYFESSRILNKHVFGDKESDDLAKRSIHRAIGVAKNIGDEEILCKWMVEENIYEEYTSVFKSQNIWD